MIQFNEAYVLKRDSYKDFNYTICHDGRGYRTGYILIPKEKVNPKINIKCHGGITYSYEDDNGDMLIGFDCSHSNDLPDPELPKDVADEELIMFGLATIVTDLINPHLYPKREIRTQEYVINECKKIIDQLIEEA